MSDLRKAAEMALDALDMYREHDAENIGLADAAYEELRQALAQPEQEPVGYVTIETISSWAKVPSIKWFKKPTEGPLYTAPVDAVNMSQERVNETAKREHEPFIYVREDNEKPFGGYEHCSEADAGAFPVYTAPLKREWVCLTDEEIEECKINGGLPHAINWRLSVKVMEAKLKEKNT
jgi:hypothetical protein